ncbi:hypothetical protein, partial [Serratia marcescens]|uniref:hypothetical protein n=1 Tax=Serratia marcescens TaxID=615 RepID=UPI0019548EB9
LIPQSFETAPKDRQIIANSPAWQCAAVVYWQVYDKGAMEETGEPGYWAYAESLIGDVAGEANDATEWCDLPPTWFKELKGGS